MTISEHTKVVGDITSFGVVSATLMSVLPPVAALLTVVWTAIRIYETRTVQKCLGRTPRTRTEDRKDKP